MRSFIQPLRKEKEDQVPVKMPESLAEELRLYTRYLDSPRDYVVCEIVKKAFRKDKGFQEWRRKQPELAGRVAS